MIKAASRWFAGLPTGAKLLLIMTAALLPIGLGLVWVAEGGIREANQALRGRAEDQARVAVRGVESVLARNALALRIAANGAFAADGTDPCGRGRRSLAIAPALSQRFALESVEGQPICVVGALGDVGAMQLVAPGAISVRLDPSGHEAVIRVGVIGGMATTKITAEELRRAAMTDSPDIASLAIRDGAQEMTVVEAGEDQAGVTRRTYTNWPIGKGELVGRVGTRIPRITTIDRLILLLPVLMWVMAAVISWLLITRVLIRPLKQLQRAVALYQPGDSALDLPQRLGPATEIEGLRDAFGRAVDRIEESERQMAGALDGQRRLVREVHHRVKNNLQVVASLLNIHGRSAVAPEARAAYASIGRRVSALSIVHRNHFAEMEENRGIALRPLLTELAAELRAGAPDEARGLAIDLEVEAVYTTQDVAVSVAFLMTEIIEFAMLNCPDDPVEISLRRTSELTARLALSSKVLVPDDDALPDKVQFERIIAGLAKQLRSPLERKLGRYSVELPAFPPH